MNTGFFMLQGIGLTLKRVMFALAYKASKLYKIILKNYRIEHNMRTTTVGDPNNEAENLLTFLKNLVKSASLFGSPTVL